MVPAVSIFARTNFCICLGKSWKGAVIGKLCGRYVQMPCDFFESGYPACLRFRNLFEHNAS